MSASILTMWPTHFTLLLTILPVELFCCITYFLRSFILLSSTLFVRVIRQNQNQPCSCCCCSVNATVSRYRLRHACVTQALRTCPFQLFQNVSVQHDSLYLSPSIHSLLYPHRISTSECSSSLTIPPSYTKPSSWLNSLSSNLMFKSSLWCQTYISSVFSRLIIGPCFLNTLFHSSNTSCSSCFFSAIMARSFAYIPFLRTSFWSSCWLVPPPW